MSTLKLTTPTGGSMSGCASILSSDIPNDIQLQLESAIMRANEDEVRMLIAEGADVDIPPRDPLFAKRINPNEDSGLTILAHVIDSGIEVCTSLKFDREVVLPSSIGRKGGNLRTYDVRWMDMRRLLLAEGGGPSGWKRIPRGWGVTDYTDMNEVCVKLFGAHAAMNTDGNTIIDMMVRNHATLDKQSSLLRRGQFISDLSLLIDRLDGASASHGLGKLVARLTVDGAADLAQKGHESAYAVALCLLLVKLDTATPDVSESLANATWGAFGKQIAVLDLAWSAVPGVDRCVLLERMLKFGCDPNRALPDTGRTALMGAVRSMAVEALDVLLKAGADPEIKDYKGKSAENYIPRNAPPQVAETLRACLRAWKARASISDIVMRSRIARQAAPRES